ncbi:uncharacterized protein PAN0_005d2704 [Moesziomyces antarcticus]|uniref:Uncharacterized protein n=2 Tax=Pseudozyma antarctica TaxID=84753 RepID=A0A5C3FND9_PSEA2|nr:uncharacterized protein PAN0_005d2704 [Moesziomyces antarcticus]GAK64490.1 hypothetical protein PAN0_005d2704 [Moesziomyces antarcticus]SPO45001.1 uncharacterized protein PSANT_02687 [Moesziomyces antarcticus]
MRGRFDVGFRALKVACLRLHRNQPVRMAPRLVRWLSACASALAFGSQPTLAPAPSHSIAHPQQSILPHPHPPSLRPSFSHPPSNVAVRTPLPSCAIFTSPLLTPPPYCNHTTTSVCNTAKPAHAPLSTLASPPYGFESRSKPLL